MLTSKDRILTTHCGSLPRPAHLSDLLLRQEAGEPIDTAGCRFRGELELNELKRFALRVVAEPISYLLEEHLRFRNIFLGSGAARLRARPCHQR